jgi:malate dehydrogenase
LSLLLKVSPLIDDLALYDVVNTPGVGADLSHISTPAVGFVSSNQNGENKLRESAEIDGLPAQRRWHEAGIFWC